MPASQCAVIQYGMVGLVLLSHTRRLKASVEPDMTKSYEYIIFRRSNDGIMRCQHIAVYADANLPHI